MKRLAIIADDLSSATDCGAQVVRSGLSVVVPLGGYSLPGGARPPQVISVDTDSRSLSSDDAYAKVRIAAQQLVAEGWTNFYKSVDSTLRGNLAAEIDAGDCQTGLRGDRPSLSKIRPHYAGGCSISAWSSIA
jgi:uncharacterized protein YgbK (DUF1537 family)